MEKAVILVVALISMLAVCFVKYLKSRQEQPQSWDIWCEFFEKLFVVSFFVSFSGWILSITVGLGCLGHSLAIPLACGALIVSGIVYAIIVNILETNLEDQN